MEVAGCRCWLVLTVIVVAVGACAQGDELGSVGSSRQRLQYGTLDCEHTAVGMLNKLQQMGPVPDWPPERSKVWCTAAYIGNGYVLTAAHCVEPLVRMILLNGYNYPLEAKWEGGAAYFLKHPQHNPVTYSYDVALCKIKDTYLPENIDPTIYPMPIATSNPALGDVITIVGHSESYNYQGDFIRRQGPQTVTSAVTSTAPTFYVDGDGTLPLGGDSGSPSLRSESGSERIVSVTSTAQQRSSTVAVRNWINTNCSNCVDDWMSPPPGFIYEDKTSSFCSKEWGDADQDGVPDWKDNCPNTPNAPQANCGQAWRDDFILSGARKGDACDPFFCLYVPSVTTVNHKVAGDHYLAWSEARVYYRGSGYEQGKTASVLPVDAYYCACHDNASADPKDPTYLSDEDCDLVCRDDGTTSLTDPVTDVGWQRLIWETETKTCHPDDLDGDGKDNECKDSVPDRVFRRIYAGTSIDGKSPGDFEKYWTSDFRTGSFDWRWRTQDYPHALGTFYDNDPPINHAKVRIWVRPDHPSVPSLRNNTYTKSLFFQTELKPIFFAALTPWQAEYYFPPCPLPKPRPFPIPDPSPWPIGAPVLHPLVAGRPTAGVESMLWPSAPAGSAAIGMVVGTYDAQTGAFTQVLPSRMQSGATLNTVGFAAARVGQAVYVFGGTDATGTLSSSLWQGAAGLWRGDGGDVLPPATPAFLWTELPVDDWPPPRADALLVADEPSGRLILMYGEGVSGTLSDVWAYDLGTGIWSETAAVQGLSPRHAAGYSVADGRLYVYGGRGSGYLDGLYEVEIATLVAQRLDMPGGGPGPRAHAALHYDAAARAVLLFGGEDAQGRRNDLWRFDLDAGKWAQVTTGNEPGAPPAMAGGVLVTSPVDGTISVLAGVTNQGAAQPAWQRTAQGWQAYSRVLSTIRVAPACLWPSNHKMVRYELGKEIRLRLPDDVGSQAIVRIKQVVSSEPEAGPGSGKLPDAVWGDQALCVRSERDGNGPGRTYSVEIEVMDLSGLVTYTAEIVVPHSVSDVAGCAEVKPVFVEDDGPCCTFPPSP